MKRHPLIILTLAAALMLLSGCGLLSADQTTATEVPGTGNEPVAATEESATEESATDVPVFTGNDNEGQNSNNNTDSNLRPIDVLDVRVEVGVGSPIPVTVLVAGTWPGLCAQLAQIDQSLENFTFDISLLADVGPADCPPDNVGLSFGMGLPINIVELPEGNYTVTVNGVSTTFDVPVTPTVPIDPSTGAPIDENATPPADDQSSAGPLCPEVPRPALALLIPGEDYLISNPLAGGECRTTLAGDVPGLFQVAGDAVYYTVLEGDAFVVKRMRQSGEVSPLSFTSVAQDDALLFHTFVVSEDGSRIAWSAGSPEAGGSGAPVSNMWVSGMVGDDVVMPLPEFLSDPEQPGVIVPVRFSADNATLYYTIQPVGLGGAWSSFVGRYDNLYALRLNTEAAPTLIFDCAQQGLFLCLGDFLEVEGQVAMLAYVDNSSVIIMNGQGDVLNTLTPEAEYVAYPTISPEGELAFYSANLDDAGIMPEQANIHRVAPPTAPDDVLASGPNLLHPQGWLDATHVIVGYTSGQDSWGTAVVGLDGSVQAIESEPNTSYIDVLR